jgi:carboxyl-terminal processing protease
MRMTKLKRRIGLAAVLFVALACSPLTTLRAAEEKKPSRPHVVLIGISNYADKQIKPRPHAEADVKALYDVLTSKASLGVAPANIRLLLGKADEKRNSKPATRENIIDAVHWLATSAKRDDLVIFAFFGQGCSLGERGDRTCYFASDSTLKGRAKNAVAAADLAPEFDKLKSRNLAVFLDLSFKGFDPGKESIPDPSLGETPYKEFLGDDKTEEHTPLPGRVIFMATNGLAASPDLKDHGLFATAVLEGLKGDADKNGYEPDGLVTVDELTEFLNKRIHDLRKENSKTDEERRSSHFIVGGRSSHFALTTNPKAISKARGRQEKFEALARKGILTPTIIEEGRRLLERMPKLSAMRNLRKEYQKLVDGDLTTEQFLRARQAVLETTRLAPRVALNFATRVLEAAGIVDREYVKEVNKGELVSHAIRGLYRWIDEKVPEDIVERLDKVKTMRATELGKLLQDVRMRLGNREDLDKHKDLDIALQRMLGKLDPYTTYIDPETVERFKTEYRGEFTGIGVQIRKDNATDMLQVVTPIKGSPSHRLGLMAGDLIQTIIRDVDSDGKQLDKPEVLQTKDLTLTEAVKKILGQADTKVKLTIKREGVEKPFNVEITRGRIELESVFGVKRNADDSWDYWLDKPKKIAYVRLSNFARNTTRDLTDVLDKLRRQGMRGLVLDLRFNPGGLLSAAHRISDLFIGEGPIVSIRPRRGPQDVMTGETSGNELGFKMVCLVNGYSASASEIVSACLQDHKRAAIMGERSYGKGSVQNIREFDGGQIKLTIATFWRPSGKNLNKSSTKGQDDEDWGVRPDKGYAVELSRKERDDLHEHLRNSEIIPRRDKPAKKSDFTDKQLDMALQYLKDEVKRAASR